MYMSGDKPRSGRYQCTKDGHIVVIDDKTDTLPSCPKCGNTFFVRRG